MEKKKKTYVLMISKAYFKGHIREGMPTGFDKLIILLKKLHTIRGNYAYWKKVESEVNAGRAVLSIRQWIDKPYRSQQHEILQLSQIGVQLIDVSVHGIIPHIKIDGITQTASQEVKIIHNDGLTREDFLEWFKEPISSGALIHFSNFRYQNF